MHTFSLTLGSDHLPFGITATARRVSLMGVGGFLVGLGWWALRRYRDTTTVTDALGADFPRMPVPTALADSALQILAVAFGASLGREGAPRQLGAATGAWLAERGGLSAAQQRTILACGAGAGLAAVYNVPLGGAVFTLEILLASTAHTDITPRCSPPRSPPPGPCSPTVPPTKVASFHLTATVLSGRCCSGPSPVFAVVGALAIAFPQLLGNGKGPATRLRRRAEPAAVRRPAATETPGHRPMPAQRGHRRTTHPRPRHRRPARRRHRQRMEPPLARHTAGRLRPHRCRRRPRHHPTRMMIAVGAAQLTHRLHLHLHRRATTNNPPIDS